MEVEGKAQRAETCARVAHQRALEGEPADAATWFVNAGNLWQEAALDEPAKASAHILRAIDVYQAAAECCIESARKLGFKPSTHGLN